MPAPVTMNLSHFKSNMAGYVLAPINNYFYVWWFRDRAYFHIGTTHSSATAYRKYYNRDPPKWNIDDRDELSWRMLLMFLEQNPSGIEPSNPETT